jgi:hypothetical protein
MYLGPSRIIDLSEKGATIRDTKSDTQMSVGFEHLQKVNFEELLTLLPQNFDAEIADTVGAKGLERREKFRAVIQTPLHTLPPELEGCNLVGCLIIRPLRGRISTVALSCTSSPL